eukprot:GEMP01004241.1.p1 GENE.GEMP01004241.1~~GEMP01004241.1.p1  ORF type:complete len:1189 (+),score=204.44 GEMP01004241.1:150-3716(+)
MDSYRPSPKSSGATSKSMPKNPAGAPPIPREIPDPIAVNVQKLLGVHKLVCRIAQPLKREHIEWVLGGERYYAFPTFGDEHRFFLAHIDGETYLLRDDVVCKKIPDVGGIPEGSVFEVELEPNSDRIFIVDALRIGEDCLWYTPLHARLQALRRMEESNEAFPFSRMSSYHATRLRGAVEKTKQKSRARDRLRPKAPVVQAQEKPAECGWIFVPDVWYEFGNGGMAFSISTEDDLPEAGPLPLLDIQRVSKPPHPARRNFDELYSTISSLEAVGKVEKIVDDETGLEVFNCAKNAAGPESPVEVRMCRGLVLHPPSQTIVATPFVRFFDDNGDTKAGGKINTENVLGTMKLDGSLIIAFQWNAVIMTTTRRRMDSAQSLWARDWLRGRGVSLRSGWTYLFEALYKDNSVIVTYNFDSLVLLTAFDSFGQEATYDASAAIARELQVPMVPCLIATRRDFGVLVAHKKQYCEVHSEGWVVASANTRVKIVSAAYKQALPTRAGAHPMIVWREMRKMAFDGLVKNMQPHHRNEAVSMRDALEAQFFEIRDAFPRNVRVRVEALLHSARSKKKISLPDLSFCSYVADDLFTYCEYVCENVAREKITNYPEAVLCKYADYCAALCPENSYGSAVRDKLLLRVQQAFEMLLEDLRAVNCGPEVNTCTGNGRPEVHDCSGNRGPKASNCAGKRRPEVGDCTRNENYDNRDSTALTCIRIRLKNCLRFAMYLVSRKVLTNRIMLSITTSLLDGQRSVDTFSGQCICMLLRHFQDRPMNSVRQMERHEKKIRDLLLSATYDSDDIRRDLWNLASKLHFTTPNIESSPCPVLRFLRSDGDDSGLPRMSDDEMSDHLLCAANRLPIGVCVFGYLRMATLSSTFRSAFQHKLQFASQNGRALGLLIAWLLEQLSVVGYSSLGWTAARIRLAASNNVDDIVSGARDGEEEKQKVEKSDSEVEKHKEDKHKVEKSDGEVEKRQDKNKDAEEEHGQDAPWPTFESLFHISLTFLGLRDIAVEIPRSSFEDSFASCLGTKLKMEDNPSWPVVAKRMVSLAIDESKLAANTMPDQPSRYRVQIFDLIRPRGPQQLRYYQPSANCRQTWGKAWLWATEEEFQAELSTRPLMPDDVFIRCLYFAGVRVSRNVRFASVWCKSMYETFNAERRQNDAYHGFDDHFVQPRRTPLRSLSPFRAGYYEGLAL